MRILLGSRSASRRALLARIVPGFNPETDAIAADIDERAIRTDDPERLPMRLAHAKADALLPGIAGQTLLLTSDQIVLWEGELREKPESAEEARRFLQSYGQHPARTLTAVVVHNTTTGRRVAGEDSAWAHFHPIPDAVITQLIAEGAILHTAGGFQIENPLLAPYVRQIEGEPESIQGLPLALTTRLLVEATRP